MDGAKIYYRLLHSTAHLQDWKNGHYHSYHYVVPGEWSVAYYKHNLRDPGAFPLDLFSGRHTESARTAFLKLAAKYAAHSRWAMEDLKRVSQLDGVCAFCDVQSLAQYAEGARYGNMWLAEFEGTYVSEIPETQPNSSGVLVRHKKTVALEPYSVR